MGIQEKITQAKQAGYSDDEIAGKLESMPEFSEKIKTAKGAGYSSSDIVSHLSARPKQQQSDIAAEAPGIAIPKVSNTSNEQSYSGPHYASPAGQNEGFKQFGLGAVGGAADIGSTILHPIDAAKEAYSSVKSMIGAAPDKTISSLISGQEQESAFRKNRREIQEGLKALGANPDDAGFKLGELTSGIAGTAGIPIGKAATLPGKIAQGAIAGSAQTALVDPSQAATGAIIGGAIPGTLGAISRAGRISGAPVNDVSDKTLKSASDAGYIVPPSGRNAGPIPKILEGVSGKAKTEQAALIKNQKVTDDLARKAIGIPDGEPITPEATQSIIKKAVSEGYDPVKNVGKISTDSQFSDELKGLYDKYQGAAKSFPGAVKDDIAKALQGYSVNEFDSADAIKAIRSLRDDANAAFLKGEPELGNVKKGIAKAIESQIERDLASRGQDGEKLLNDFRSARKLIAKAYTVEDAIKEGSGSVNAAKLASRVQSGKPVDSELKTIGEFANNYSKLARLPQNGDANPFSVLDAATFTGGAGLGALTGNPLLAALPVARVASRSLILSPPAQNAMTRKTVSDYADSNLAKALSKTAPVTNSENKKGKK